MKIPCTSTREMFESTWLSEMPVGTGTFPTYDPLVSDIRSFIKAKIEPQNIYGNLWKLDAGDILLYWFGTREKIQIGSELRKHHEALIVSMTGKDPSMKGKPPFASDLYSAILKDTDKSLRFMSDESLSDEGLDIWKKLLSKGHKIQVYDKINPGQSYKQLETEEELLTFFKKGDVSFKRYQYILSEHLLAQTYIAAYFRLRRMRELGGVL